MLQIQTGKLKNAVFWDVALCRSCINRRFGGTLIVTTVKTSNLTRKLKFLTEIEHEHIYSFYMKLYPNILKIINIATAKSLILYGVNLM
jgi:hypothetical protein